MAANSETLALSYLNKVLQMTTFSFHLALNNNENVLDAKGVISEINLMINLC